MTSPKFPVTPVVTGAVVIVMFDIVASFAAARFGFHYGIAAPGSWLVYAVVGFDVGRRADIGMAAAGSAIVAFVEATIGWAASAAIGPGRPPGTLSVAGVIATVILVAMSGGAIGAIAGFIAQYRQHRR
jgi:hypothetical protein